MEVPVRVLRVFVGMVTSFGARLCWGGGGGGNVTFHGIQVPREHYYINIPPVPQGPSRR